MKKDTLAERRSPPVAAIGEDMVTSIAILDEWTPELEKARVALCESEETSDEHEAALTLLGDILERTRATLTAALSTAPAPEMVRVKPLEWQEPSKATNHCWVAETQFGTYSAVNEDGWHVGFEPGRYWDWDGDRILDTERTAKAAAQADYEQRIRSALSAPAMGDQPVAWRCFHCDEVFTDRRCAADHFGASEDSEAACRIKMGAERSLLTALRRAENDASEAWAAIRTETTDSAKAYYAQNSRHQEQLRIVEELGFERGLKAQLEAERRRPLAKHVLKTDNSSAT